MGLSVLKKQPTNPKPEGSPQPKAVDPRLAAMKEAKQRAAELEAVQALLDNFEEEHAEIFAELMDLKERVQIAQDHAKEAARKSGSFETKMFDFKVDFKVKRWYDADRLLQKAPEARNFKGLFIESVDTKMLKKLIDAGQISKEVAAYCEKSEDMTPAVTIKRKI